MNTYEIILVVLCLILSVVITILLMQPNRIKTITRNYLYPDRIFRYNDNYDKIIVKDDRNVYVNNRNTIYKNSKTPEFQNRIIINADGSEGNQETKVTNYSDTNTSENHNIKQNISMDITDLS